MVAHRTAAPVQFVRLQFSGGAVYLTTAPMDISWNGQTWESIGGEFSLSPMAEFPDSRSGTYELKVSGVDQTLISLLLSQDYVGRGADIWFGYIAQASNMFKNSELTTDDDGFQVISLTAGSRITGVTGNPNGATNVWRVSHDGNAGRGVFINKTGIGVPFDGVVPGTSYVFSCDIFFYPQSPALFKLSMQFFNSGTPVSSHDSADMTAVPGWNRYTFTYTAPAGVNQVRPSIANVSLPAGTFDVTAVQMSIGTSENVYQPTAGVAVTGGTVIDTPILAFSGFMNGGFEVTETPGRGGEAPEVTARLVAQLAAGAQNSPIRTNTESHQRHYPADMFFSLIPTLLDKRIVWGQIGSIGTWLQGATPLGPIDRKPGGAWWL